MNPDDDIISVRNIGPKTGDWLRAVGINTRGDLEDLGAVEAYRRLKTAFPKQVSLNALYGLQAAILDMHWNDLPPDMKADLRAQLEKLD